MIEFRFDRKVPKTSWTKLFTHATTTVICFGIAFTDSSAKSFAQPFNNSFTCPQLANRPYVVILNSAVNSLPQLPEFLAIAATPCLYLNNSMTFFGGFDNVQTAVFRANQLRQLGLDAVVHSFSTKLAIPDGLRASMVLVELNNEPNAAIQQVQSLTGKAAVLAVFNNRSVILVNPLSSSQNAQAIAAILRNQGFAAQTVSASLLNANQNANQNSHSQSAPNQSTPKTGLTIYRVLVPNTDANTLKRIRESAPDAFETIFKGRSYIQSRTYTDRSNAHRERDRLSTRFTGVIILQD
jgi:hypothetical protein